MDEKNDKFNYNYSAPTEEERREINSIRKSYQPQETTNGKLEQLKKIDNHVKNIASAVGLCLGIGGCLIFGLGITMVLEWKLLAFGTVVAIVGIIPMVFAHAAHSLTLKKCKEKHREEILRISSELMNE